MVTTFDQKLEVMPSSISLKQVLSVLMIGILVFSMCIVIPSAQAHEEGGWGKIKFGAGLVVGGVAVLIVVAATPVIAAGAVGTGIIIGGAIAIEAGAALIGSGVGENYKKKNNGGEAASGSCSGGCDAYSG